MALRLEITAPGAAPREVPLLPGRTEVVAAPREQYRLIGDAGEIPANVRVLRVENAMVVTGLPDGQELALQDFFRACRPGTDCTLSFAGPGAPDAVVANDSPSLAALTDGSFLLYGPTEPGAAPVAYGGATAEAGSMSPWGIGLAALLGVGVVAGAGGGGGGGDSPSAVLGAAETVPPGTGTTTPPAGGATTPPAGGTPTPPAPADTIAPTLRITDSVAQPTTNGPVTFTFAFSEPVVGFEAGDVAVTGGTRGALAAAGDGRTWTMTVAPAAGVQSGEIAVAVAAGAATDAAGNPVAATRATQSIDTLGPAVTITDDTPAAATNRPVTFTFAFSEPASGFTLDDVGVTGGVAGSLVTLSDGLRYALTVTPLPNVASGSIVVTAPAGGSFDALGNPNQAAPTATQAYDTVAPTQQVFAFAVTDNVAPRTGNLVLGETTNDRTPTLTLTLNSVLGAGETLTILRDGAAVTTRTAGQTFTYTDTELAPGSHTYSATVSDAAGNLRALDLNGAAPDTGFLFLVT